VHAALGRPNHDRAISASKLGVAAGLAARIHSTIISHREADFVLKLWDRKIPAKVAQTRPQAKPEAQSETPGSHPDGRSESTGMYKGV